MNDDVSDESAALDQVVERLAVSFPHVPADTIRIAVNDVYASVAGAHVRDFLPVIVEREAKKQLKTLVQ